MSHTHHMYPVAPEIPQGSPIGVTGQGKPQRSVMDKHESRDFHGQNFPMRIHRLKGENIGTTCEVSPGCPPQRSVKDRMLSREFHGQNMYVKPPKGLPGGVMMEAYRPAHTMHNPYNPLSEYVRYAPIQ